MKILISNDDGIDALGLQILAEAVRPISELICVSVPKNNYSGSSRKITFHQPISVTETSRDWADKVAVVDGTPTDSLKIGLMNIFADTKFDLVLSGINHGANTGHDLYYSGTFAAAHEAFSMGYASIAFSQVGSFFSAAEETKTWIQDFVSRFIKINNGISCLNINFPKIPASQFKGTKFTLQSGYHFGDVFHEIETSEGCNNGDKTFVFKRESWQAAQNDKYREQNFPNLLFDQEAVTDGFVSVTPIAIEMNIQKHLENLIRNFCKN